jgi:hypothetical protein
MAISLPSSPEPNKRAFVALFDFALPKIETFIVWNSLLTWEELVYSNTISEKEARVSEKKVYIAFAVIDDSAIDYVRITFY